MTANNGDTAKPVIRTTSALERYDEHSFSGHRVYRDLSERESYASMVALSICRRRFTADEARLLDEIIVSMTHADPRVWPLKAARMASSFGNFLAGVAVGHLCFENAAIGPWVCRQAALALVELRDRIGDGVDDPSRVLAAVNDVIERDKYVRGYGVPNRETDERAVAIERGIRGRGREQLRYWHLMSAVGAAVEQVQGTRPNVTAACAAALLDLGVEAEQVAPLISSLCMHMVSVHAMEGIEQRAACLARIPNEHLTYSGAAPRSSARAAEVKK